MKQKLRRGLSLLLATVMILQTISYGTNWASAASMANATGDFVLGKTAISQKQTLVENGDGTYTMTLELHSKLTYEDQNQDKSVSQNNYYTAPYSGYYLVELWGGNGANGTNTDYCNGGSGGSGGYIYGKMYLNAGETLYYKIGGNGDQTDIEDMGGGANGEGGGHGSLGSMKVGGGGGYSAIFKYSATEFESQYTDGNGNISSEISEADRLSKYVMIAGGGGGGGAGDGWSIFGDDPVGTADGGAGGSMNSVSGQLTGAGYAVEGTYYAGQDGKSSGRSTEYVGHGGTNVPGQISDTITSIFKSKQPNDWSGAANTAYDPGSGGSGNFRGGAGGAGYCGGSGAVMTSAVSNYNIGGGGGGSSFIASTVQSLNAEEESLLSENESETGGQIKIKLLDTDELSYSEHVSISGSGSKYFDITAGQCKVEIGETVLNPTVQITDGTVGTDGDAFAVTDLNLLDATSVVITLTLKPGDGFMGGNNVPLWNGYFACESTSGEKAQFAVSDSCEAVNVPLGNFDLVTQDYEVDALPVMELIPATNLYTDPYNGIKPARWEYDFISEIKNCTVKNPSGANAVDGNGNIAAEYVDDKDIEKGYDYETTRYTVSYQVIPKTNTGYAAVGNRVATTDISAFASIILPGDGTMNGNDYTLKKTLTYDEELGQYILEFTYDTDRSTEVEQTPGDPVTPTNNEYTVPEDGWYLIQAWGGKGGKGGNASYIVGLFRPAGGEGGNGGYVYGYLELEQGDRLIISTAESVGNGDNGSGFWEDGSGGPGGKYTTVCLNNGTNYLMIAGGGGGGSGGNTSGSDNGDSPSQTTTTMPSSSNLKAYEGSSGTKGSSGGGAAGINYRNSTLNTATDDTRFNDASNDKITAASTAGTLDAAKVQITRLYEPVTETAELKGYTFNADISKYFNIENVTLALDSLNIGQSLENVVKNENQISISGIDPSLTVDGTNQSGLFTVKIYLTPKEGFLGGNDVPVLDYSDKNSDGTIDYWGMSVTQLEQTEDVPEINIADFANVEISEMSALGVTVEKKDHTILPGQSVAVDDMYTISRNGVEVATLLTGDWKDDFVQYQEILTKKGDTTPITYDSLSPAKTTEYTVTVGLAPLGEPQKAAIREAAAERTATADPVIYVLENARVVYNLTNLTTSETLDADNSAEIEIGVDYKAKLSPAAGYQLPENITIQRTEDPEHVQTLTAGTDYTYDKSTGNIVVFADSIEGGEITITAVGPEKDYFIYYIYEREPGEFAELSKGGEVDWSNLQALVGEIGIQIGGPYKVNASLSNSFDKTYAPPDCEGYTFKWTAEIEGETVPATMPAADLWVLGSYQANEYDLTVQYLERGTEKVLADPSTVKVEYLKDYSITPKEISGYLPEATVMEGTMDSLGKTVTFYYTASQGQLNITYIYGDTNATHSTKKITIQTGGSYSETSPVIDGYTPDQAQVTYHNVTAEQVESGINVTVTYTPNKYTVTFDPNGGNVAEINREVTFKKTYNYISDTQYEALPTPVKPGATFKGWALETAEGEIIKESSVVTLTRDHKLVAKWENQKFNVVIEYVYENGSTAAPTVEEEVEYGKNYSVSSPTITGYTPDLAVVSGTMAGSHVKYIVTYISDTHELRIYYRYADDVEDIALQGQLIAEIVPNPYVAELKPGDKFGGSDAGVVSPNVEDYDASQSAVVGTMGSDDVTYTVYYYDKPPVISVTVSWGDLTFNYEHAPWLPETHTYGVESIQPSVSGTNTVTVLNNVDSSISVNAEFSYEENDAYVNDSKYENLDHFFTSGSSKTSPMVNTPQVVTVGEKKTVYFWLKGTLDRSVTTDFVSGDCIVTISGGG